MVQASDIRLLVCDDEAMMRSLMQRSLKHMGFSQISEARDGEEALALARARRPHIVISDYDMPGMDGLALVTALRGDPLLHKVGFILLSGVADEEIVRRASELGVNSFIRKPFSIADLRRRLDGLFFQLTGSRIS
ncbi:response regulator [Sphingosinicella sp. LY1275]|uniref:response regulator n=1 Tax=Sphingosinicella sp. LY1275 TaxID=3095379 RepID=UPI002ADED486|nr:response regulator [Sphingosinicella sp. LY1275]MEA1013868.1 response regulator [Sphingosinicella sp. LY1275]